MNFTIIKAAGQKRKCGVVGCERAADKIIMGEHSWLPICSACLKPLTKTIIDFDKTSKIKDKNTIDVKKGI